MPSKKLERLKIRRNWRNTSALLLASLTLVAANKCPADRPVWEAEFWAGDSANVGITRKQENRTIPADSPEFNDYVCTKWENLQKLEDDVLSKCEKWSDAPSFSPTEKIERQ